MNPHEERLVVEVYRKCGCCNRCVPSREYDELYSCCHGCAFCSSLEHFEPCHHGACKERAS